MNEVDTLRVRVLEHYTSIYAFCRVHPELRRAMVYLILSGRYPGKWSFQAVRIRAALTGTEKALETPVPGVTRGILAETLQSIQYAYCRRLSRREYVAYRDRTERGGKKLFGRLFQGE